VEDRTDHVVRHKTNGPLERLSVSNVEGPVHPRLLPEQSEHTCSEMHDSPCAVVPAPTEAPFASSSPIKANARVDVRKVLQKRGILPFKSFHMVNRTGLYAFIRVI